MNSLSKMAAVYMLLVREEEIMMEERKKAFESDPHLTMVLIDGEN